jgi:hypothetical protein
VQRPWGLRQKILQVGKGEIEAQSALGRLEVGGVLRCAGLEPFEVVIGIGIGIGGHFLHAQFWRSRSDSTRSEHQSVNRKDQEPQLGLSLGIGRSSVPKHNMTRVTGILVHRVDRGIVHTYSESELCLLIAKLGLARSRHIESR